MKSFLQFIILQFCIVTAGYSQTPLPPPANKVALVIGNAKYAGDSRLNNAENDADAIATFLKQNGFKVLLGKNLTRQEMKDSITIFEKQLKIDGISLFFFSGHGMEQDGHNYLIPIGTDDKDPVNLPNKWVDLDEVLNRLKAKECRLNLILLDACRTPPPPATTGLGRVKGVRTYSSITPIGNQETIISFAAESGKPSYESNNQLSFYTEAFLDAAQHPCKTLKDYFPMMVDFVSAKTNQAQIPSATNSAGQNASNFSFVCQPTVKTWKIQTTRSKECKILEEELHAFVDEANLRLKGKLQMEWVNTDRPKPIDFFNALKTNEIQLLHGSAYYWMNEIPAAVFFSAIPFGMDKTRMERWLKAEGLDLWQQLYELHGVKPFPCGHTGPQMGGWFNREITSVQDFRNLWMRMPGLGGKVLQRFGTRIKTCNIHEIYGFMNEQTDRINHAAEYIGPYDDYNLGLHNVANYYYEEGWQEPNTTFELLINQKMLDALDESTRNGLINLIEKYNKSIYTKYLDKNAEYKHKMLEENIVFKHFPEAVLVELRREAAVVLQQYIHSDESKWCEKIYNSYRNF